MIAQAASHVKRSCLLPVCFKRGDRRAAYPPTELSVPDVDNGSSSGDGVKVVVPVGLGRGETGCVPVGSGEAGWVAVGGGEMGWVAVG